jgi:hypothetical protein
LLVLRWEYEQGQTKEAQLCKDFDKLEMIQQAVEYEQAQSLCLQDFFDSTANQWRTELGCGCAPFALFGCKMNPSACNLHGWFFLHR